MPTGNAPEFPSLVSGIIDLAAETSHPPTQRSAFTILGRFILHFGAPEGTTIVIKNWSKQSSTEEIPSHYLPGFETVIYEKLIPLAFDVPVSVGFNVKDGQSIQVSLSFNAMANVDLGVTTGSWRDRRHAQGRPQSPWPRGYRFSWWYFPPIQELPTSDDCRVCR